MQQHIYQRQFKAADGVTISVSAPAAGNPTLILRDEITSFSVELAHEDMAELVTLLLGALKAQDLHAQLQRLQTAPTRPTNGGAKRGD